MHREDILARLSERLEPKPYLLALWEGGSAAFGQIDEWSDIDLMLVVADGAVESAFADVEAALASLSPIELRWHVRDPGFAGVTQRFYRLADAPPTLLIDCAIVTESGQHRFIEPEQHGRASVLFDKAGLTRPPPFDEAAFRARMKRDLAEACARFEMLETLTDKELRRGHPVDAFAFYQSLTFRPLVLVLGMKHRPLRYDFGPRYVTRDFPPEVARELAELTYVRDAADLQVKLARAQRLFRETVAALDLDATPLAALSAAAR